jgi:hypothetical protein
MTEDDKGWSSKSNYEQNLRDDDVATRLYVSISVGNARSSLNVIGNEVVKKK